jgi:hypothetical protein
VKKILAQVEEISTYHSNRYSATNKAIKPANINRETHYFVVCTTPVQIKHLHPCIKDDQHNSRNKRTP